MQMYHLEKKYKLLDKKYLYYQLAIKKTYIEKI